MPSAVLEVLADPAAVAERVAERVLQAALQCPELPLGLATGRTMVPVYSALVRRIAALPAPSRQQLLTHWRSFNLDEYVGLGPDHPQSFAAYMQRHLGSHLGLRPAQLNVPNGLVTDPDAEAARYSMEIKQWGGIGLQLLGLGLNGHVGFNEPPCGPESISRCVSLSLVTRQQNSAEFGGVLDAVPTHAISLGMTEILQAKMVLLVVTGFSKAAVLKRLLTESPNADLPASWLADHPNVNLIVDRAASEVIMSRESAQMLGQE